MGRKQEKHELRILKPGRNKWYSGYFALLAWATGCKAIKPLEQFNKSTIQQLNNLFLLSTHFFLAMIIILGEFSLSKAEPS